MIDVAQGRSFIGSSPSGDAADTDIKHTAPMFVSLDPGFQPACTRRPVDAGERALGLGGRRATFYACRSRAQNGAVVGNFRGVTCSVISNRPDLATSTSQKPKSLSSQPARGPRQSCRVRIVGFSRGLPSAIRTGSKPRRGRHVLEPGLVSGVHLGNDVGVLVGDVVQLERVVLHVEELERRLPCVRPVGRLGTDKLVRLRSRGEGPAELGLVAAVPLEK